MEKLTLKEIIPEPTYKNPYAQVDFIFQQVASLKHNPHTQDNYRNGLAFYKKFLKETNNYDDSLNSDPRFYLKKHWDEFTLLKVKTYIDTNNIKGTEGYLTSYTISGYFSAIRNVIEEAVGNKLTLAKNIYITCNVEPVRETQQRSAYSKKEMESITEALQEELRYSYKVLKKEGYKKTGIGKDPRNLTKMGSAKDDGWGCIENFRWYFENVLECAPIIGDVNNKIKHKSFVEYAPRKYFQEIGGLPGIYKKWGVAPFVDSDVIMPLVTKLALETGLNTSALYNLNIDCYNGNHPLSGVPYIKYYKLRSGGEKEMHLNPDKKNKDIHIKQYRHNQAQVIKKTIEAVIELTKEIRKNAPSDMKQKLFLYQSDSQARLGRISLISSRSVESWCAKIVRRHNLQTDDGQRLIFNLSRFRPTRVTSLVEKGIDLFELQYEMGHADIRTTLNYIESNHLNFVARRETKKALDNIFLNNSWAKEKNLTYATSKIENENFIYKGLLCDCKNPFNPPKEVKSLKNYVSGQACSRYNMCLFCENVLIFKKHLPLAWVYKRQIETSFSKSQAELPNELFYRRTLDIIEQLFESDNSEFSGDDIEWAKRVAEEMDVMIDPVTYIPTVDGG
ncbi:tyrosine-type recombinase/integrase [Priestia aryabhattai]|uniref:tyrosine-type recombinase/integrase n=1 Tax=Priestia aryabhattai TaxID=412384 RepID=UPI001C8DAAFF|nr:tyrosine-type recombinase/integrase [Priestia aryabhattai]MBX9996065.1 tyrosine-type recombinase/integrase [Priestia aryabhattai]